MVKRFFYGLLAVTTLSLGMLSSAQAQQLVLRAGVFSAGGQQSTGGILVLWSTLGQPGVGRATGGTLLLEGGFWPQVAGAAGPLALPTATDDAATTDEDTAVEIAVLANDTDPGGGTLTIFDFESPAHGQAFLSSEGGFTYEPAADFFGEDGFVYYVRNERGGQAEATVVITVNPVNDAPVFAGDPPETAFVDTEYRYVAQTTDVENDARTFTALVLPAWLALDAPTDSTVTLVGTPATAEVGQHPVTMVVSDGQATDTLRFVVSVVQSALAAPVLAAPENGAADQPLNVPLRWNPVAGATGYETRIDTDSTFQLPFVADVGTINPQFTVQGLLATNTTYYWRVRAVDASGAGPYSSTFRFTTALNVATEDEAGVPTAFALRQNYPNPFNPITTIAYELAQAAAVRLVVYDLFGREVKTLVQARQAAGRYTVPFEAEGLASGTYFYRIEAGSWSQVKQFILLK